jgi:hypothetical protein
LNAGCGDFLKKSGASAPGCRLWLYGRHTEMKYSLSLRIFHYAKVAVVDSVEVGRSAVYSRYNNGPRTLPWGTPTLTGEVFQWTMGSWYHCSQCSDCNVGHNSTSFVNG